MNVIEGDIARLYHLSKEFLDIFIYSVIYFFHKFI